MVPGTLIEGRFELERMVGTGGMGVVFRALDRASGAPVAVKFLRGQDHDPAEIARFTREGQLLAELQHPGIVRYVSDGFSADGQPYLVMEWLEGEDLEQRLVREALTPAQSLSILRQTAAALAVAHARGLLHRDLKPSNVFLVGGSVARVKLLDFGIALQLDEHAPLTAAGVLLGTLGYIAPEQVKGLPISDARSDVFALGCVLFECLTGRRTFEGESALAVLTKILLQEVPPLRELRPDLSEPLEQLVASMLARDPDDRLRDAAAVVEAIDALEDYSDAVSPSFRPSISPIASTTAPLARGMLTLAEQRLVSVVLAHAPDADGLADTRARAALDLRRHGGRLEVLAGGALLVTIWGAGSAVDRAVRAGRCALALSGRFPGLKVCVITGRGVVSARVLEGEVIDRGARALHAARVGAARVDAATAEMIEQRFVLEPEGDAFILSGERIERLEHLPGPLLLGKATAFVGRAREVALIEALFSAGVTQRLASAVLVTGPVGSGKSRLRRELVDRIRRRGEPTTVLMGRADSLGESSPFGIVADAIRDAAGIQDGEPIEARRQKLTARFARHLAGARLARVSAFLGEMSGTPFPDESAAPLRAARASAQIMGDAMRGAWEEWIAVECATRPLVLVLEDLQWGDAATVRLVDATLRNLHDQPLLVLVLARPEIHARFPGLWTEGALQEVKLGPLPRKASVELVGAALGPGASPDLIARVIERADGNPFYLEELVRAVAAGRGDVFPDSVLATVEARLDAEGQEAKRVLRAASVFGARFSTRGVAALLGGDLELDATGGWLSRLSGREVITALGSGAGADAHWAFGHALLREAAYATLTEHDRALGHRLAGAWLEASGSIDAVALAEHFLRGGEPLRAVRWYRRSAEQALAADDLAEAIARARRGDTCGAAEEELGALRLIEAEARIWLGDLSLGEQRAVEARALFPPGSEGWLRGLYHAVVASGKLGHVDRVEGCFLAAREALNLGGDAPGAQISCLCACASNLIFGGRYAVASEAFDALAPLSPPDALSAALIHQSLSFRASARGDSVACLEGLTATLAAFEQAEDRRNACSTRVNLGFILAELGEFEGAEEALRAALLTADRLGLHELAAVARYNLGYVLCCRDRIEEARRLLEQSIETFQRQEASRGEGLARTYLAQVELRAGDRGAAEREARTAAGMLVGIPSLHAVAVAVLGRALLDQGRTREALAAASEGHAELVALGSLEEGEALVRLVYAEALAAAGRAAEFAAAIGEARDRLLVRAAQISDGGRREHFLASIPDNARTVALAGGDPILPPGQPRSSPRSR